MPSAPSNLEMPDDVRRQSIIAILISTFGAGITFGIGYPLVSLTLEAWKEPAWVIGVAGGAPWLAIFLTLPFLPRILRRLGPVRTSVLGCIICAATYLAMSVVQSTPAWIALRFVQGAATALPWLIGETWINSTTRDETRTRVVAVYALVFFAGFAAGPLLLDWTGTEGFLPFAVSAAGPLFTAIPIVLARHLAPSMISDSTTGVLSNAMKVPAAMASSFTGGVIESIYFSLLPTACLAIGIEAQQALRLLTVFIIGGLAIQLVIGWIGDRISRTRLAQALGIANLILTIGLSSWLADPVLGPALVFVIGGVTIGFYTLGLALLGEGLDARNLAAGNSAYIMMYTAGAVTGPAIAGAVMSSAPMFGFVASTMVAAVLFLAAVALIPKRDS